MKSRYRKTLAGVLWVILNPVIMFGVQALVFRKFLNLNITDYHLFLAGGLIPWIFMSQTVLMGTPALISNAGLLRSFRLHPLVLVTSSVLDNFINFLLTFIIVVIPVVYFSDTGFSLQLLWLPVALIPMFTVTFASTIFLSVLNVFYRDTNFVMGFVFSLLFFLTPVFYPADFVPSEYRWMIELNPFYPSMVPFRSILSGVMPAIWFPVWMKAMAWGLGFLLLATLYWRRKRNELFIAF